MCIYFPLHRDCKPSAVSLLSGTYIRGSCRQDRVAYRLGCRGKREFPEVHPARGLGSGVCERAAVSFMAGVTAGVIFLMQPQILLHLFSTICQSLPVNGSVRGTPRAKISICISPPPPHPPPSPPCSLISPNLPLSIRQCLRPLHNNCRFKFFPFIAPHVIQFIPGLDAELQFSERDPIISNLGGRGGRGVRRRGCFWPLTWRAICPALPYIHRCRCCRVKPAVYHPAGSNCSLLRCHSKSH